jgi:hypothetical protein
MHEFAAVFRIADQPLPFGIDEKIEHFQRHLADQQGATPWPVNTSQ